MAYFWWVDVVKVPWGEEGVASYPHAYPTFDRSFSGSRILNFFFCLWRVIIESSACIPTQLVDHDGTSL